MFAFVKSGIALGAKLLSKAGAFFAKPKFMTKLPALTRVVGKGSGLSSKLLGNGKLLKELGILAGSTAIDDAVDWTTAEMAGDDPTQGSWLARAFYSLTGRKPAAGDTMDYADVVTTRIFQNTFANMSDDDLKRAIKNFHKDIKEIDDEKSLAKLSSVYIPEIGVSLDFSTLSNWALSQPVEIDVAGAKDKPVDAVADLLTAAQRVGILYITSRPSVRIPD